MTHRDLIYLRALSKLALCKRLRPDEAKEMRRRRFADGTYPVPAMFDPTRKQA